MKEGYLVWSHLRRNWLLKHIIEGKVKGREDEEEEVSKYWMNVKRKEDIGN
jgi:hypothetical protein